MTRRLRTVFVEGFKTFAEPVSIDLAEGLTCVVGPNGCGKSNLIDAIAWAVGSRSWKALRGAAMGDVVFHGTEGLPPAGSALVRLVFDNSDRALSLDAEEVEVARELVKARTRQGKPKEDVAYGPDHEKSEEPEGKEDAGEEPKEPPQPNRTPGSKVFINRVEGRIKDLQVLLAGTGLVGGFSIVRQGTIEGVILASPEEIGAWIEEAAGIARYRRQKAQALLRLEKVRAHLDEVDRQRRAIGSELKKIREKAKAAGKKRDLERQFQEIRLRIVATERRTLEEETGRIGSSLARLREEDARLKAEREELVRRRARAEEELAPEEPYLGTNDCTEGITDEEARAKSKLIVDASRDLQWAADLLSESGPAAWPDAGRRVRQAIRTLQSMLEKSDRREDLQGKKSKVALLRRISRSVEKTDAQRNGLLGEIIEREKDLARLKERLRTLPQAPATPPSLLGAAELDAARVRAETLEFEIAGAAPVDETADERRYELERRRKGLNAIARDLRSALRQILDLVERLDIYAGQVFIHTLRRVEKKFREIFGILFGPGGRVRLRLAPDGDGTGGGGGEGIVDLSDESKNPAVEIRVKLPWKAEAALTLLSMGERSLAGIALVLALSAGETEGEGGGAEASANGGRLLVLDEVDAALDEANARRFARLVHELSKKHQILCVTHNPVTIHQASRLIGISSGPGGGTSRVLELDMSVAGDEKARAVPSVSIGRS